MAFRFWIVGHSNDADSAVEEISDIIPLEEATSIDNMFIAETRTIDGLRNRDIAEINQLQADGKIDTWSYHNKGTS